MNYGSLTYTPMQNRIPSMCNVGNRKLSDRLCAVQRNPLQQKKIPPDPPVHLSERSAVLVRTRSRLVEVCAVKVVRSRVARTRGNGTSAALLSLALPDFLATNRPWIPCRKLWRKSPSTTPDIEDPPRKILQEWSPLITEDLPKLISPSISKSASARQVLARDRFRSSVPSEVVSGPLCLPRTVFLASRLHSPQDHP